MSCVAACPCGWKYTSCTRVYLLSRILHLTSITINGVYEHTLVGRPHWVCALLERWGVSMLHVWSVMDFTMLWKYWAIKWESTLTNVYLLGWAENGGEKGGTFTQVGTRFPLLLLHSVIWETLHLPGAIAQHVLQNAIPVWLALLGPPSQNHAKVKCF